MSNDSDRRREIKRLFALRESLGLSFRELAERSGVPLGTLHWWSHRLRSESRDKVGFVDLGVVQVGSAPPTCHDDSFPEARLVFPSGLVIELRGEFADQVVSSVLHDGLSWS